MEPGRFDDQPVTAPVVWMPHNEISNSPSTPILMTEGPFAGQIAIGDVTYGGDWVWLDGVALRALSSWLSRAGR